MIYKLIMLPQPILVSDSRIKVGEPYHTSDYRIVKWLQELEDFSEGASSYPKPIIAGIEGLPILDLSAIAERIGWVDVEKLAIDLGLKYYIGGNYDFENGVRKGILEYQSLNEKKYSEEDMRKSFDTGRVYQQGEVDEWYGGKENTHTSFEDLIKSLSKPKEYNVECIQEGNTIKVTKILS